MMGVPSHYQMLAEHPRFADADLSALRLAVVVGAPMPPALVRTWYRRGVRVADPATGQVLGGARSGELLVGGPGVFAAADTAAALADGWLHTLPPSCLDKISRSRLRHNVSTTAAGQ